jgi:hypothetical protein
MIIVLLANYEESPTFRPAVSLALDLPVLEEGT